MAYELKNVLVSSYSLRALPAVQLPGDGSVHPADLVALNPQPLPPKYRRY